MDIVNTWINCALRDIERFKKANLYRYLSTEIFRGISDYNIERIPDDKSYKEISGKKFKEEYIPKIIKPLRKAHKDLESELATLPTKKTEIQDIGEFYNRIHQQENQLPMHKYFSLYDKRMGQLQTLQIYMDLATDFLTRYLLDEVSLRKRRQIMTSTNNKGDHSPMKNLQLELNAHQKGEKTRLTRNQIKVVYEKWGNWLMELLENHMFSFPHWDKTVKNPKTGLEKYMAKNSRFRIRFIGDDVKNILYPPMADIKFLEGTDTEFYNQQFNKKVLKIHGMS